MRPTLVIALALTVADPSPAADPPDKAAASRDALALVRRVCFECHGPEKQRGELRLDTRAAALAGGETGPAVVPDKTDRGELLRRVALPADAKGAMPPRGERLSAKQLQLLRDWIDQGAEWPAAGGTHWAYVAPRRPTAPLLRDPQLTVRNPIDAFVLARLPKEGLKPSPEAPREILIRRLSLDITGLPPTPAEIDAFVNDKSKDAYEKVVDRLLASPQFGVKWARPWLDAARYADSHGFQRDDLRDLWAYRDWVVTALNADMPFDRFTIEQLAGDLLPNATQAQKIATGFNRNAPTNVEAGSDPEDTRVNQVFDRVNTVGTVWLGSTLECAQCHDHKYDPFTQKDYYRLFAFFNSTAVEAERANPKVPGSIRFLGPALELNDPAADAARAKLQAEIAGLTKKLAARADALRTPDAAWEAATRKAAADSPREHVLEVTDFDSSGGATHEVLKDGSVLISGDPPDRDTYTVTAKTTLTGIRGFKLEALTDPSLPGRGPGRGDAARPNFVLNTFAVTVAKPDGKPATVKLKDAKADFSQANFPVAGAIDADPKTAWAINPQFGKPHWAVFATDTPLGFDGGTVFTFTLVQDYGAGRTIGRLRLSAVTGGTGAAIPSEVADALAVPAEKRTAAQQKAVLDHRLSQDVGYARLLTSRQQMEVELAKVPTAKTLVMQELNTPRPTTLFKRGDFRTPGVRVEPGTPVALPPLDPKAERNRLGLAKWLVARDNPLTARVTVNRLWAELFGRGLVTTPEDFGVKGEPPTHPELLDWLAVEFQDPTPTPPRNGEGLNPAPPLPAGEGVGGRGLAKPWSVKHLLRTIVLSATYRQSSRLTPDLKAKDPENRLLARGARFRLDAEGIRDNALSIAGLLSPKLGGPPVRPPQPEGLWVKVGGERYDYVVSPGEDKYRRGLYVIWKRAAPYPSFVAFDAPSRQACRVSRPRTNTPLQALTLLNDPVYVEAALAFAKRVVTEKPDATAADRIAHAFRLAMGRTPTAREVAVLKALYDAEREAIDPAAAKRLVKDFAFALPAKVSAAEFAAWYAVCAALLNLDETITKG
jgi:mono/diheme cytochrome c family protein